MYVVNAYNSMLKRDCFSLSFWLKLQIPRNKTVSTEDLICNPKGGASPPRQAPLRLHSPFYQHRPSPDSRVQEVTEIEEAGKSVFLWGLLSVCLLSLPTPISPERRGWIKTIEKGLDRTFEEHGISP